MVAISAGTHALGGDRRGADAQAARDVRRAGVVGDGVLVEADAGPVEGQAGLLAREVLVDAAQVDQQQVVVGAAGHEAEAVATQALGQGRGVGHHRPGVVGERRVGGLGEGDRLGRDDVVEGPALEAGEDGLVDGGGVLGAAQDGTAPGAAQGLVGGEGGPMSRSTRRAS